MRLTKKQSETLREKLPSDYSNILRDRIFDKTKNSISSYHIRDVIRGVREDYYGIIEEAILLAKEITEEKSAKEKELTEEIKNLK